jgi:hypothetical protein
MTHTNDVAGNVELIEQSFQEWQKCCRQIKGTTPAPPVELAGKLAHECGLMPEALSYLVRKYTGLSL